jgi:hypothetical protein
VILVFNTTNEGTAGALEMVALARDAIAALRP